MREQVGYENVGWDLYPMFCSNCGTKIFGLKNREELIKYRCDCCGYVSVRKEMGRRHSTLEIYAPRNMTSVSAAI